MWNRYLHYTRGNVILVILSQSLQKFDVAQQTFARSPVVQHPPTGGWIFESGGWYVQHHANRSHYEFHSSWRASHRSHDRYVGGLQSVQSRYDCKLTRGHTIQADFSTVIQLDNLNKISDYENVGSVTFLIEYPHGPISPRNSQHAQSYHYTLIRAVTRRKLLCIMGEETSFP